MPPLSTYWHTIRRLRPVQLYGRVWYRLFTPRPDHRPPPPVRVSASGAWTMPAPHRISVVGPERFDLLGETRTLADHGWDDPAVDRLWRYNLHYFDDLSAPDAHARAAWQHALLRRWVAENAPGQGTGWEPYPTSLRIVNWAKWSLAGETLPPECVQSLAAQTRWLTRRLERHLLGNHLFANAKALVFAGLFFEGAEAEGWLAQGLEILNREIPEQILADGGQFELSPMYHALALEDLLDLHNVARTFADSVPAKWRALVAAWPARIAAMRFWLAAMCHPDGEISFFNDATVGIAPPPAELEEYARRLEVGAAPPLNDGVTALSSSGYVRLAYGDAVAILDVAQIGPAYLPAHAHADTLSFELSVFGQRVLVNSGISRYGDGAQRLGERGTAAHNTVVVDGTNSSEVWSGFRVGRRARPLGLAIDPGDPATVVCAHDGYRRLHPEVRHERRWKARRGELRVEDQVTGRVGRAEARFHLHPEVTIADNSAATESPVTLTLRLPRGQHVKIVVEQGRVRIEASGWHPGFGREVPNRCVVVELTGKACRTRITWSDAG